MRKKNNKKKFQPAKLMEKKLSRNAKKNDVTNRLEAQLIRYDRITI